MTWNFSIIGISTSGPGREDPRKVIKLWRRKYIVKARFV
jgi:hypothetical protein